MSHIFKPMKAPQKALTEEQIMSLPWPMLASVKLDGIRGVVRQGVVTSNSGKPIRSKAVQKKFAQFEGMDGELIYGPPSASNVYNLSTSFCNSTEIPEGMAESGIHFFIFDDIRQPGLPYKERFPEYANFDAGVLPLKPEMLSTYDEFLEYEAAALEAGFEGVMLRKPNSPYKEGRSTLKEAYLLKIKRFSDAEAVVIGSYEEMHNTNEAKKDEQGHTARSMAKDGLVPKGTLGGFRVRNGKGQEFDVGGGFTAEERVEFWKIRQDLVGKVLTYKYFAYGEKNLPRFPTFKGWRDEDDITNY